MSTVVIFGSNVGATPLIHALAKRGYEALVLGHDPRQMGAKIACRFKHINYRNLESSIKALSSENEIVGYVPGAHDLCYLAYAKYMDYLAGRGDSYEQRFEAVHNKARFRQLLKKIAPNRCPDFMPVSTFFLRDKGETIFPALYKPEHAGGGYGIERMETWNDAASRLQEKQDIAGILEQIVEGEDYSISIWLKEGVVDFFYADREVSEGVEFKISGSVTTSELMSRFDAMGVPSELAAIVAQMGIKNGFVHCQIRMDQHGAWYLIEITLRMPGDCYQYVSELFSDFDYSGAYLSTYLPEVLRFDRAFRLNRPKLWSESAYGRVCLGSSDDVHESALSYLEVFSHERVSPERYKISFFKIDMCSGVDVFSKDLRLTRIRSGNE